MSNFYRTDFSRVFFQKWGAGPENVPVYEGQWKAGAAQWPQGEPTLVRIPAPDQYGQFDIVGKIPGEQGNPTLEIMARYNMDISTLLQYAKDGCDSTLHIHMGLCSDPRDFNGGFQKALILEKAVATDWGTDDLGALEPSDRALVNETVPFTGEDLYEVRGLNLTSMAGLEAEREVVSITICDSKSCGLCGLPSDGCSIIFAAIKSSGGSPGIPSEIIWTDDKGATWNNLAITTLGAAEDPNDAKCVGTRLVVVSEDSESLHYATINDILAGTATWVEMSTGFVATKGPLALTTLGAAFTWISAEGGYIYFTSDVTSLVTVQTAGNETTQDLNSIDALDQFNVLAVGNSNAVLITRDGGSVWETVTGPSVGVNLNTCKMISATTWWVGTAGGKLFYTLNAGATWTEKAFPGSGAGTVKDIKFTTPSVGYLAHATATPAGRILRTTDGGYSWYVLPEGTGGAIPANDRINSLAVCSDANLVFGGGLGDDALDGIIVKAN